MIEEAFLRMYATDFVHLAARAEQGQDVGDALRRRISETRVHAALMDRRKAAGHLEALVDRLQEEAGRFSGRGLPRGDDPAPAFARHRAFLSDVAARLSEPEAMTELAVTDVRVRKRRSS